MSKATKPFKQNFHGILSHDGWIRVAKSNITAKVVNIQGKHIRVKSYNTTKNKTVQYNCNLHKNLQGDLKYIGLNDTVSIKWNMGKPYIVGYRKANADDTPTEPTGDKPVSENMDWISFFRRIDAEC